MAKRDTSIVDIHVPGPQKFELAAAILVYQTFHRDRSFATVHSIDRRRSTPTIGVGQPASAAACRQLLAGLAAGEQFNGFIDDRMLYIGQQVSAWWRPPQRTRVHFDCVNTDHPDKHLGQVSRTVPLPGLVFALAAGKWYVFAVKGADRPTPATRIFRAPFFNVWEQGHICEGNIERPAEVNAGTLAAFERAFFESRFTHPNVQRGADLTRFKGGPYALWRALLNVEWVPCPFENHFPEETLVDTKRTLANTLKKLEDKNHDSQR